MNLHHTPPLLMSLHFIRRDVGYFRIRVVKGTTGRMQYEDTGRCREAAIAHVFILSDSVKKGGI